MDEKVTEKVIESDLNISKSREALHGELIQGEENIAQLSREWDELFARAKHASVYLSRAWIKTFIDEGHIKGKPCFIVVWYATELVALLPLEIQSFYGIRIGKLISIEQPTYLGLLMDPEYPEATGVVAETWIRENVAHVFHDKHVFSLDEATKSFVTELNQKGFRHKYGYERICKGIELGYSFDEYLQNTKTGKRRRKLAYAERQLYKTRNVQISRYNGKDISPLILKRIAQIQEESWMKQRGAAVLGQSFYQKLLKNMSEAGLGSVWIMTINGDDAAFAFTFIVNQRLYYHWPAFKLEYESSLSIGQILLMQIIRDACAQNIQYFDFGHGDAQYKSFWANQTHNVYWVVSGKGIIGNIVIICYQLAWCLARQKYLLKLYKRILK